MTQRLSSERDHIKREYILLKCGSKEIKADILTSGFSLSLHEQESDDWHFGGILALGYPSKNAVMTI